MSTVGAPYWQKMGPKKGVYGMYILLACLTICLVGLAAKFYAPPSTVASGWGFLLASVVLAELLPVQVSRRSLHVTFTMPYVLGMAMALGTLPAIGVDILATFVGSAFVSFAPNRTLSLKWLGVNFCLVACAASAGCLALLVSNGIFQDARAMSVVGALSFLVAYAFANYVLIVGIDALGRRPNASDNVFVALGISPWSVILYATISVAVASLVRERIFAAIPLTLVPVWAFRTALSYRTNMNDHYLQTIGALTDMLERAHPYTRGHVERVSWTAEEVGRRLGLPPERSRLLREAAILHDIGKITVDEAILEKPARLTPEEYSHVKTHALAGAQIIEPVQELKAIVPWIKYHHERPDGKGYPFGLSGTEIPVESCIIAVIDAFDAMTGGGEQGQTRSYRKPMSTAQAIEELEKCAGTQFDVRVVQAFKAVVAEDPSLG